MSDDSYVLPRETFLELRLASEMRLRHEAELLLAQQAFDRAKSNLVQSTADLREIGKRAVELVRENGAYEYAVDGNGVPQFDADGRIARRHVTP